MRNAQDLLLEEARTNLSTCGSCPFQATCAYLQLGYAPEFCLHEDRLLRAYLALELRRGHPRGASGLADLAEKARDYAGFLRRERPFDPRRLESGFPITPPSNLKTVWPIESLVPFGVA